MIVALATFGVVAGCGFNAVVSDRYDNRDRLEDAATALLMGMSPTDDEASAVWPGARSDQHWLKRLPMTAEYLQAGGLSYAYHMPALGQFSGWPTVKIYQYTVEPVPESRSVCRFSGNMASFHTPNILAPERFFPITTIRGEVIGYAVRIDGTVHGHLICAGAANLPPLFLSGLD